MPAKRSPAKRTPPPATLDSGITKSGVKKTIWFHEDEAEALRVAAFQKRRSEAAIIREAVRRFLRLED